MEEKEKTSDSKISLKELGRFLNHLLDAEKIWEEEIYPKFQKAFEKLSEDELKIIEKVWIEEKATFTEAGDLTTEISLSEEEMSLYNTAYEKINRFVGKHTFPAYLFQTYFHGLNHATSFVPIQSDYLYSEVDRFKRKEKFDAFL